LANAGSPRRPDIAIVLHDLRGGGAERAMLRLAGGFAASGRQVDLVTFTARGEYLSEVPDTVRLVDLEARRALDALPKLRRRLRADRPGVVLSALTHVNIITLLAARTAGTGAPVFVSERNQASQKAANGRRRRSDFAYSAIPMVYPWARGVIAVSQGVADDLVRFGRLPAHKVHVAHNPVFNAALAARAQEAPSHPWALDGGAPVILAVGRLAPQKDYPTLLKAFAQLRARRPCRLLILGEGDERARLEALARELGLSPDHVALPGFIANPLPMMAHCAVFAMSSRFEGFPNVMAEALACGAPVASTDCDSGPSEILEGGRYGLLSPVGDAAALAVSLEALLADPPPKSRQRARGATFSVEAATERYLGIFAGAAYAR
jgi:glycosyltransferase involved in cell wall biosynthesis